ILSYPYLPLFFLSLLSLFLLFNHSLLSRFYTLPLLDALPISAVGRTQNSSAAPPTSIVTVATRKLNQTRVWRQSKRAPFMRCMYAPGRLVTSQASLRIPKHGSCLATDNQLRGCIQPVMTWCRLCVASIHTVAVISAQRYLSPTFPDHT